VILNEVEGKRALRLGQRESALLGDIRKTPEQKRGAEREEQNEEGEKKRSGSTALSRISSKDKNDHHGILWTRVPESIEEASGRKKVSDPAARQGGLPRKVQEPTVGGKITIPVTGRTQICRGRGKNFLKDETAKRGLRDPAPWSGFQRYMSTNFYIAI